MKKITNFDEAISAIKKNFNNIVFLSDELKDNREIAITAVGLNSHVLQHISVRLKNDYDIVMIAVSGDGLTIGYASKILQDNKQIALLATKNDPMSLHFVSERLQNDRDLLELYLDDTNDSIMSKIDSRFQQQCKLKLQSYQEQDFLENNIPYNNVKSQTKKF